jgi:hypothetical protein
MKQIVIDELKVGQTYFMTKTYSDGCKEFVFVYLGHRKVVGHLYDIKVPKGFIGFDVNKAKIFSLDED